MGPHSRPPLPAFPEDREELRAPHRAGCLVRGFEAASRWVGERLPSPQILGPGTYGKRDNSIGAPGPRERATDTRKRGPKRGQHATAPLPRARERSRSREVLRHFCPFFGRASVADPTLEEGAVAEGRREARTTPRECEMRDPAPACGSLPTPQRPSCSCAPPSQMQILANRCILMRVFHTER